MASKCLLHLDFKAIIGIEEVGTNKSDEYIARSKLPGNFFVDIAEIGRASCRERV